MEAFYIGNPIYKTQKCELWQGDCLEIMKSIPDKSVDMVLCDLPYGTTACKWDSVIPQEPLWGQYKRVVKEHGAIVLFCQQPFTSFLVCSNPNMFKYMWYWRKPRPSGFTNAKLKPLKDIEEIAVFSTGTTANRSPNNMPYYPLGLKKVDKDWSRPKRYGDGTGVNPSRESHKLNRVIEHEGYPRQILEYPNHNGKLLHPTQKPVALLEYLIHTYTNETETILDNCMGSGSTGVAAMTTNRKFVGIELDPTYCGIAHKRIQDVAC